MRSSKSKMRQKQRERTRANRADTRESNKYKITSTEKMTTAATLQRGVIECGERAKNLVY